jgi:chromosome partitioning protein
VLLVDMDPQGNMSSGVGVTGDDQRNTSYEVLLGEASPREAILPTALASMDLMPTGQRLSGAEVELVAISERESRLKSALAAVRDDYDYILVDSPPSLGLLTVNSLNASDSVIIPLQCEYLALEGLTQNHEGDHAHSGAPQSFASYRGRPADDVRWARRPLQGRR